MFIQIEETPNPATLKFLPGKTVLTEGTADFPTAESAQKAPLARQLFSVDGIVGVFFGADFVSVTKSSQLDWFALKPLVLEELVTYFTLNDSVEVQKNTSTDKKATISPDSENTDIISEICELLDSRVRPAVAMDGGDITFERFENGIVYLQLKGACSGCPSSADTLKMGIENMLKYYIPEVVEVKAV